MTKEECMEIGGHCWVESNYTMLSDPPTYERRCKHCDLVQWGRTHPARLEWTDK